MRLFNPVHLLLAAFLLCSFSAQAAPKSAKAPKPSLPLVEEKDGVVLMPLRLFGSDKALLAAMEASVVDGLQLKYKVYSGEKVANGVKEIYQKESAKKDCDASRCFVDIAVKFKVGLIATAEVNKSENDFYLVLSIRDVMSNEAVFSKTLTCKKCEAADVVDKLKELSAMVAPAAPVVASAPIVTPEPAVPAVKTNDAETALWEEVKKGNTVEDYAAYLKQYPKGSFVELAKSRQKKIKDQEAAETRQQKDQATAERVQEEQRTWDTANTTTSEESYQSYLDSYPKGRFASLASARITKLKKEAATAAAQEAAQARAEAAKQAKQDREATAQQKAQEREDAARQKREAAEAAKNAGKGPLMVRIPGKNYEMGKYEVTQKEWRDIMGSNPSDFSSCGDNCPVEKVNLEDIQTFLQKLNQKTGKQYRLPTEEEWGYASYGGSQTVYCGSNDIDNVAWYAENSGRKTHPVGQKQANGYGLYDMCGNVSEWRSDCYYGDCAKRVLRGGSWFDYPSVTRSDGLLYYKPELRSGFAGFRVARTLP
jgi:formylglycine-generating enzyme required for sulfatase activity